MYGGAASARDEHGVCNRSVSSAYISSYWTPAKLSSKHSCSANLNSCVKFVTNSCVHHTHTVIVHLLALCLNAFACSNKRTASAAAARQTFIPNVTCCSYNSRCGVACRQPRGRLTATPAQPLSGHFHAALVLHCQQPPWFRHSNRQPDRY